MDVAFPTGAKVENLFPVCSGIGGSGEGSLHLFQRRVWCPSTSWSRSSWFRSAGDSYEMAQAVLARAGIATRPSGRSANFPAMSPPLIKLGSCIGYAARLSRKIGAPREVSEHMQQALHYLTQFTKELNSPASAPPQPKRRKIISLSNCLGVETSACHQSCQTDQRLVEEEEVVAQVAALVADMNAKSFETVSGQVQEFHKEVSQMVVRQAQQHADARVDMEPAAQARLPQNVDPGVVAQALQAGVSPAALAEIFCSSGSMQPEAIADSSEEEELAADGGGGGTGSQSWIGWMPRKGRRARPSITFGSRRVWISWPNIEQYPYQGCRSEGFARSVGQGSKTDLSISGATSSGVLVNTITAHNWLEHYRKGPKLSFVYRPSLRPFGRHGWLLAHQNKPEEARARAGSSLAMLDQQGCDAGGWLIASELALEPAPPYSSFSSHVPPSSWETPHTKLIDSRFFDLVVSKLKDLADFQDKKHRLGGGGGAKKTEGDPKKGAGKGKKGGDVREAEPPLQVNERSFCRTWEEELPSRRGSFRSSFRSSACAVSCRSHFADWEPLDGDH